MNKRQKSAIETKRKLISAGLELIKEKGFNAINVEDITKKAGVAKGTFYIYFKRKEDIVMEISRTPFGEIADNVPETMDSKKWFYDYEMLESILKNAKELKEDTPIESLTHIIISELYGMMLCWCMSDGKFEPLDWTDRFCDVQLTAIFKPYLK